MPALETALVVAILTGNEVDSVLRSLVKTELGSLIARDACAGLLPCSSDYYGGG